MSVDIILGSYNGEKYIKEQIESILGNTYENWRLMVFDDGSLDNTELILREYENKYPKKINFYKNEKNLGVVKNFLSGAMKSTAEYIMFCDQDDVWLDKKIENTLRLMKKIEKKYGDKNPICVFSDAKVVNENLDVISDSFFISNKLDTKKTDMSHLMMENKLLGCTLMFNSSLREKLREIPNNIKMHDWWIGLIGSAFGHIGFLNESTMMYRQHGTNVIGNQDFKEYVFNRLSSLKLQRNSLKENQLQAEEFYRIYKNELQSDKRILVREFYNLKRRSWLGRRAAVLKYGYLKTGIIRNGGVLLLI